jgi:translation initiation factor 1
MDNDWKKRLGVVYSTNPDFDYSSEEKKNEETPAPGEQLLYVSLDKKNRKGKAVTLIEGFRGTQDDLKELSRVLKAKCGVGGSGKDGLILIQGDFRERVANLLKEMGYSVRRKGG